MVTICSLRDQTQIVVQYGVQIYQTSFSSTILKELFTDAFEPWDITVQE